MKREITIRGEESCDKKRKMFKKLRQTVLLSPEKKELWDVLSCVYKEGQFFENRKALDSIAASVGSKDDIINILNSYIADQPTLNRRIKVALVANRIADIKGFETLKTLAKDDNPDVRVIVAEVAGIMGDVEGFQILNILIDDPDVSVRAAVAEAAGAIGNEDSLWILNVLVGDLEQSVQTGVAIGAGLIGGKEGFMLLKTVANNVYKSGDKNNLLNIITLRKVAYELIGIGSVESYQLMQTILQNPVFWKDRFGQYVKNSILYYLRQSD